jgi:predicted RNase H-like HicB family nuclease
MLNQMQSPHQPRKPRKEEAAMSIRYSIVIEWSDEDQAYVVCLPEWQDRVYQPVTDGATYEEAARKGENVLDTLIEQAKQHGEPLPAPRVHAGSHA